MNELEMNNAQNLEEEKVEAAMETVETVEAAPVAEVQTEEITEETPVEDAPVAEVSEEVADEPVQMQMDAVEELQTEEIPAEEATVEETEEVPEDEVEQIKVEEIVAPEQEEDLSGKRDVNCPHCGQKLRINDDLDKAFICPKCRKVFRLKTTKKYSKIVSQEILNDEILLSVKDLKKHFVVGTNFFGKPTAFLKAVDNVSFDLRKGTTLGIVGESGCGKTTMGRTILRLYDVTGGSVKFKGQELTELSNKEFDKLRPNMQMIFQDPYASLSPRLTVGEIIGEAARQHGLTKGKNYRDYVLEIMKMCGLQPHYFERYPHEFSGGQRQRICIARALALKPDLVICDEPVSALDVSIQAQIINMLKDLQKELGLTYVFISHDLSVVKHISDEIGVMYLGSMVEYGSKTSIFENTLHPYTKALFSAVPIPDPHTKMNRIILKGDIPSPVNPPKGCKFHTRCDKCMEVCKTVAPKYLEVEKGHFCACHLYDPEYNGESEN